MSARGERTLWIGLGVLVAGALVFAIASLRREEREIETGFRGEARTHPFLAAERFLSAMGLPARRASGLALLPPADHALLLALPAHELGVTRAGRLLDWVRGGGHVIATATGPGTSWQDLGTDPLLTACQLAGIPSSTLEAGETEKDLEDGQLPSAQLRREERKIEVEGERRPLALLVRTDLGIVPSAEAPEGIEPLRDPVPAPALATCRLGEGRITVLADLQFATNAEIGERDHARLLFRLAGFEAPRRGVWIVRQDTGPSLAALLFGRGLPVVLALALLGAAAGVRGAVRFGPVLPLPARGRRSLLEHVEAVGALLWRRKRQDVLLQALRTSLSARTAARRPDLLRLPPEQSLQRLAAGAGVDPEALRSAVQDACPEDPESFVRAVRTLQSVRRSL